MLKRMLFVPLIASASLVLAGCGQGSSGKVNNTATANASQATANATAASTNGLGGNTSGGSVCGGIANQQCASASQYCEQPVGQCATTADGQGTCAERPGPMCTEQYVPVCGCDGKTYGNACQAGAAGVSVSALGECPGGSGATTKSGEPSTNKTDR